MSDEPWLSAEQQHAWRSYVEATKVLFDALDRELQRDADMPHAYYEVLVRLSEADGHASRMSDLAAATMSSRSRLSHAVARLEERGWVTRSDCATDRRGQVATLTDQGMDALRAAAVGHVATVRRLLVDALRPDQLAALGEISVAVRDRVRQESSGSSALSG